MSAILPPSDRLWWKQPIDKVEWAWIAIAFVWGMIMFGMMIYWHVYGKQNLSNEAYKITPELFAAKAEKFIAENTIRTETDQDIPVVKVTPTKKGTYAIVCNEYCGIGHSWMLGRIYVK